MGFAYAMLFYVIYKLHDVWTVKLYIIPDHRIEKSFLFRTVRHPNYYLNIIPELIGIALLCNAWYTLLIGLPIYACLLAIRIRQEERAMKELVKKYGFYPELCDTCRKGNLLKIKSKRRFYKSLCGGMTRDLLIKPFFVCKGLSFNSICVTEPGRTVRPADHIS